MQGKGIYNEFCEREKEIIPLFHMPFWLDIVSGPDNWDVTIIRGKDDQIEAVWPYHKSAKYGISKIGQGILTPYLGPIIKYPINIQKRERKYSYEIKVLEKCIASLPSSMVIKQGLHPSLKNWTPFYWKGYQQSTKYTYVLDNIKNHEQTTTAYKSSVKNQARAAKANYSIHYDTDIDRLYELNQKSYERNNVDIGLSKDKMEHIYTSALQNESADIITVIDDSDRPVCSCLIVYDRKTAYSLLIGVDKELRPKGAVQWMLSEAVIKASERVDRFDFEGSMLPEVEPVFRAFGGERIPYSIISRAPRWFRALHELVKGKDFSI